MENRIDQTGIIFGKNAVVELIKAGSQLENIYISQNILNRNDVKVILGIIKSKGINPIISESGLLDKLSCGGNHQGFVAKTAPFSYVDLNCLIKKLKNSKKTPIILILDHLQDPHNLGSIIRTSEVLGADGIIIPKDQSVQVTSTVIKISSGSALHLPVCRHTNLVNSTLLLKKEGFWIIGADADGDENISPKLLACPLALIIGCESKGIRRLLKEQCDLLWKIPMHGKIKSLNASIAAGIILYELLSIKKSV